MSASQRLSHFHFLGFRPTGNPRLQHRLREDRALGRLGTAGLALLVFLLVLNLRAAGQDLPRGSSSPSLSPNATSLNGPGNVFLTASVVAGSTCRVSSSNQFAIADFNGDGKPDLAVPDHGCHTGVSILLGNGDGTFQAPVDTANLGDPTFVAVGDFNGDGKQDLAVIGALNTNLNVPAVYILLGNGDGTFTLKTTLTGFVTPNSLVLGDFNGDGKLDMAVVDSGSNSVLVFLGNGDGTVGSAITTASLGTSLASYAATGDFNKDGKLDLVLSDLHANQVVVLLGNGNGTFQAARSFALPAQGWDVAVGDFNGDGVPDIAATSPANGQVNILLGKGDGTFQPAASFTAAVPDGGPTFLALGDFNNDGKTDIVTGLGGVNSSATVSVLFGKGDGTFSSPSYFSVNSFPAKVAVADLNGDGNLDWIIGSTVTTRLAIGLGTGKGTFEAASYPDFVTPNASSGVGPAVTMLGDFNNDGKPDMVASNGGSATLSIFLGNGDGTFQPALNTPIPPSNILQVDLAIGDFNNDGKLDVVTSNSGGVPATISVLLGKGDGTFQAPVQYPTGGSGAGSLYVADFNGDGKLDVLVVNESDNTISILLGNGDGTFQAGKITPALASDGFLGFPAVGDFNGDGKLDVAIPDYVGSSSGTVSILLGKGDGTFQAPTVLTSGAGSTGAVAVDLNKDGKLDLAVANQFGTLNIFLGNGDGTFNTPSTISLLQTIDGCSAMNPIPLIVTAADFNLDGNVDLLVGDHTPMQSSPYPCLTSQVNLGVQLFLGNGDGTFQPLQDYMAGGTASWLAVADVNGDGAPDVVADSGGDNVVNILLNQTVPPVSVSPKSLTFANQLVGTTSAAQPLTVTNNGSTSATISIAVSGDFGETNTCGASLASKASCTISVTFKPTATGLLNGDITVTDNLPGSPQKVPLSGTGVAPIVTLGGNSIGFGNQNVGASSAAQMVGLSNTGTATLTISSIAITGANAGDFAQTNTCGGSVAAGANCSISVTFKPTATGNRTASVTIADDATGSPQNVTLTGTGVAPSVMLSGTSINFGNQLVTTSSTAQNNTLTNNGTSTLSFTSITITGANSGDFSETNTCGGSVAAGANCSISVTFKPTAAGNRAASVTIADDATGSPQAVSLSGTGTDFTIDVAAGGSNSATVTAGQPATYNLQVTPVSGFNGTVSLSCTGAPSEATCTPSVTSVTPNGNAASAFTVSITTTAASILAPRGMPPRYPPMTWLRIVLPWVLLFTLALLLARQTAARRHSRWALAPAVVVVLGILSWIGGCGGGGGGGGGGHNPGTPTGTYTLTVTGSSGGVSHTLNLTLKVN